MVGIGVVRAVIPVVAEFRRLDHERERDVPQYLLQNRPGRRISATFELLVYSGSTVRTRMRPTQGSKATTAMSSSMYWPSSAMFVVLMLALFGCVSDLDGRPAGFASEQFQQALPRPLSSSVGAADAAASVDHPSSLGQFIPPKSAAPQGRPAVTASPLNSASGAGPPHDGRTAAGLLDHWGHRRVQSIVEGLSLGTADPEADGADFRELRSAVQAGGGQSLVPDLHADDDVGLLGARRGITYGRWTGGPADTLQIEFDLSQAGPMLRNDPAFRAVLERAGALWSRRIADTWASWERAPGDLKGWLHREDDDPAEVRVGEERETSSGLTIHVWDADLPDDVAGRGGPGVLPPLGKWESHFGQVLIDRGHRLQAGDRELLDILAHEIGHVLGAWYGDPETTGGYAAYTDVTAGTWTGPNVVALHGGPAPFQDDADPLAWVDGERDPNASEFDFHHSGVCSSIMAYCNRRPAVPHAIDFAFLTDLGMTVIEETDRPETYGLAGWTDYAGFSLTVSRDQPDEPSATSRYVAYAAGLGVPDLPRAAVDVFGYRSTADLHQSWPAQGPQGAVRYSGGLLGAAIDRTGLPPVTGAASLAVDLGTLDGEASFTSLKVHTWGTPEIFAGGSLLYPFELSANAILGTRAGSTLRGDFYGPGHENVAGVLRDPGIGLMASFGATRDDRPGDEDRTASSDPVTDPAATTSPVFDREDDGQVGANVPAALDRLAVGGDYGGVTVSSGYVQDGAGADRVLEYLERHTREDYKGWRAPAPGLATFADRPVVRLAEGMSDELAAAVEQAVRQINTALPREQRIALGRDPVPPLSAIEDVPAGEIFVDFAPSAGHWNVEGVTVQPGVLIWAQVDPVSEFDAATQRLEDRRMRAAHVWLDEGVISNAAWVLNADEERWEYTLFDHPVVESDTVMKVYEGARLRRAIVVGILESLGLLGGVDASKFPESIFNDGSSSVLSDIDSEALLAAYTRLLPGTLPEDLSAEGLGSWTATSFHLAGELGFSGGEAAFGVALRNGLARPWATGPTPLAALENNSALFGTVSWNGALLGFTPLGETVSGHAQLAVEVATLDGHIDFVGLERWNVETAPGRLGTGTTWGDGDLGYSIVVEDNSFHRTGGDDGEVVGEFFGGAHEAMAGVLERNDLTAGFGGLR